MLNLEQLDIHDAAFLEAMVQDYQRRARTVIFAIAGLAFVAGFVLARLT